MRSMLVALLCICATAWAVATTVTVNGKTVTVPVIKQNGKVFVDIAALAKLLGGSATFNAGADAVALSLPSGGIGSIGASELPGEDGKLGTIYTLRKHEPVFFCLQSVEYSTTPVALDGGLYMPNPDEKLLVLHFTVQNPNQKEDLLARNHILRIIAVDSTDTNITCDGWGNPETHASIDIRLKPAQKISCYAVIPVPAKNPVPKLIIQPDWNNDGGVLRFDLHGKVKPLTAPYADPADASGATPLTEVPAECNKPYPFASLEVTLQKMEYTTTVRSDDKLKDGERALMLTWHVKNLHPDKEQIRDSTFSRKLVSVDGEELACNSDVLFPSSLRPVDQAIPPGGELTLKCYFKVPKDFAPKALKFKQNWYRGARTYLYPVQAN